MARGDERPPLDRVGRILDNAGAVGQRVFNRNLRLWSSVSENVRGERYGGDELAQDTAQAMAVAMDNLEDLWTVLTRVPERDAVATALPTAFLSFARKEGKDEYDVPDPVRIRVPGADEDDLAKRATIVLSTSGKGADALQAALRVVFERPNGYRVEATSAKGLKAGLYSGLVYVTEPRVRPLANLRVLVGGEA